MVLAAVHGEQLQRGRRRRQRRQGGLGGVISYNCTATAAVAVVLLLSELQLLGRRFRAAQSQHVSSRRELL